MQALAPTLIAAVLIAAPWRTLVPQWELSAEVGVARFSGTSRDSAGATVGPYRPTTFGLRLDRALGPVRVSIGVLRAKTGLAAEGHGIAVVQYDVGSLWEIAPDVSLRVARFGAGIEARIEAGPAIDLWSFEGEDRNRLGGRAALALEWPLAHDFTGSLRVNGALIKSVFDRADAPSDVELHTTRRLGVGIGLRYRL